MANEKCCCDSHHDQDVVIGEYVCYCNHVTESDIIKTIKEGAQSIEEVIEKTGAMKNSNCAINNPKGTCCYSDIEYVFNKHKNNK